MLWIACLHQKEEGRWVRLFVITEAEFDRRALQKCEIYERELGSI